MICGGKGNAQVPDAELSQLFVSVKPQVEANANLTFTTFEPVSYRSQVVAGTNYFVKFKVDGDKYVHARIFKPLPCYGTELQVSDVSTGLSLEAQI